MLNTIKLDTNNYHLMGEVYYQIAIKKLSYTEVATLLSIRSSDACQLYSQFMYIKARGDFLWLDGLSNKAKAMLMRTKYRDLSTFYHDVTDEKVDLEDFYRIGHKLATHIRKWCVTQRGNLMPDKPTTKECPKCGDTHLVCIATQNEKLCTNCFDEDGRPTVIPWFKEEGESDYV